MSTTVSSYLLADLIAGSVPYFGADPEQVAYYVASTALGVENVLLHASVSDGVVFYLAIPGKVLASTLDFSTPLVAACPGSAGYRGNGNYLFREGTLVTVVRKHGDALELVSGDLPVIDEYLANSPLPVYEVTSEESVRLVSRDLRNAEFGRAMLASTNRLLLRSTFAMLALSVGMAGVATWLDKRTQSYQVALADGVRTQIKGLSVSHDLAKKMADLGKVSAVAARAGGWITEYRADAKGTRWVLEMPSWISADYYDSLGPQVKADINRVDNTVLIYKGMETH